MSKNFHPKVLDAIARCLRPLAQLMLGSGVSYKQFEEIAKRVFVEQAAMDQGTRVVNTSRIAVRTGLSRKEIARLRRDLLEFNSGEDLLQVCRPARVLQLWHSTKEYITQDGNPIDLPLEAEGPSFATLVREVGGDVPAGAVKSELVSAGCVTELTNGRLRALKRVYVPSDFGEDLALGLASIVAPMLDTLHRNLELPEHAFIQRVAYSDHIAPADVPKFRQVSHESASSLMHELDKWIADNEEQSSADSEDFERRVGLGVFYFENSRAQAK